MFFLRQKSNYPIYFTLLIIIFFGSVFYDSIIHENYRAYGISYINTAIHEGGHVFFGFFGNRFLYIAGGTIMQLLFPLLILWGFIKQKDFFGVSIIFAILGINLFHISEYAGDAIVGRLPILMFFGEGKYTHDWSYMLNKTGLLYKTDEISFGIWISAIVCFIIFFLYSTILIINRFRDGEI